MKLLTIFVLAIGLFCTSLCGATFTEQILPLDWQNRRCNLLPGMPSILLYEAKTQEREKIGTLELELELPEFVSLLGADSTNMVSGDVPFPPDRITRDGNKFRIRLSDRLAGRVTRDYQWMNFERLYLSAPREAAGKNGTAICRLINNGRAVTESKFDVTVLEPFDPAGGAKCRRFQTLISSPLSFESSVPEVAERYGAFWSSLVEKPYAFCFPHRTWSDYPAAYRERFLRYFEPAAMIFGTPTMPAILRLILEPSLAASLPRAVDADGKPTSGQFPCASPAFVLGAQSSLLWDTLLPEQIRNRMPAGTKLIAWDYEPGHTLGFELENRKLFAASLKLKQVPDSAEIRSKFPAQWVEFRKKQHAQTIRKFAGAVRKHFPQAQFALCTDPLQTAGPVISDWCAVDSRLSDGDVDFFMNMPYESGRYFHSVALFNNRELKKPNFPLINPSELMEMYYSRYSPEKVLQNILSAAATGSRGIGFWQHDVFDGAYFAAISRGFRTVAQVEEFYAIAPDTTRLKAAPANVTEMTVKQDGKTIRMALPDFSKHLTVMLHAKDGEAVITAFNYHAKEEIIVRASLKNSRAQAAVDLVSGIRYDRIDAERGFLFRLPPNGSAVLKLSSAGSPAGARVLTPADMDRILAQALERQRGSAALRPISRDGAKIAPALMPGSSAAAVRLSKGEVELLLDLDSGENFSWSKLGGKSGSMAAVRLNDAGQQQTLAFAFRDAQIGGGVPRVLFAGTVGPYGGANPAENPLEGLEVTKSISLERNGIVVKASFRNRSPRRTAMTLDVRIAHTLLPGGSTRLSAGKQQPENGENLFLRAGLRTALTGRRWSWDGTPYRIEGKEHTLRLTPLAGIGGIYCWVSPALDTVEPCTGALRLDYGRTVEMVYRIDCD